MHSWLITHEGKRDVRGSMGTRKHMRHKYLAKPCHRCDHPKPPSRPGKCRALCCGSTRLSVSSSAGDNAGSSSCVAFEAKFDPAVSNLAHAMVQARLEQMIKGKERQMTTAGSGGGGRCVLLVALNKESYDPREDFRESMLEVITSNGLEEPRELRNLLNCYMSMNPVEHRVVILEAFHEVCTSLFTCKF